VQKTWDSLPGRFRTLVQDAFQIMPNHLHGVLVLPGPGLEPALAKATGAPVTQPYEDRRGRACPTLVSGRHGRQEGGKPSLYERECHFRSPAHQYG
jgi:hypothetical protein